MAEVSLAEISVYERLLKNGLLQDFETALVDQKIPSMVNLLTQVDYSKEDAVSLSKMILNANDHED